MKSRIAAAACALGLCACPAAALPSEAHIAGGVPEPTTWALIVIAVVAVLIRQLRRLRRVRSARVN